MASIALTAFALPNRTVEGSSAINDDAIVQIEQAYIAELTPPFTSGDLSDYLDCLAACNADYKTSIDAIETQKIADIQSRYHDFEIALDIVLDAHFAASQQCPTGPAGLTCIRDTATYYQGLIVSLREDYEDDVQVIVDNAKQDAADALATLVSCLAGCGPNVAIP